MIYESKVVQAGLVQFPQFKGERIYMHQFYKKDGLPLAMNRWQSTVDQMLTGIETDQPIYLMVDERFVTAGITHRRPGIHIDGYWNPGSGHTGHRSNPMHRAISAHGPARPPSHGPEPKPVHRPTPTHGSNAFSWECADFKEHEAIILASNIAAARGFEGQFNGPIKDMGACEHISVDHMKEVILHANTTYVGNVTFLHESIPVTEDCFRSLVRLNVPGLKV